MLYNTRLTDIVEQLNVVLANQPHHVIQDKSIDKLR